jgi:hypothetical protein
VSIVSVSFDIDLIEPCSYENGMMHQMNTFDDEAEEDLRNEIVAELDARDRMRSNINEEDDSVFSDVVQDAFRKYQNEVKD